MYFLDRVSNRRTGSEGTGTMNGSGRQFMLLRSLGSALALDRNVSIRAFAVAARFAGSR